MNRRQYLVGGLGAVLAPLAGHAGQLTPKHGFNDADIDWLLFDDGRKRARREGKPIFFLAHTTWCPHCAGYRDVFFDEAVVALMAAFVPVLVDRDLQPDVSAQFAPDGDYIPRTMFLTPDARLAKRLRYTTREFNYFVDYEDPSHLRGYLKRALRRLA